MKASELRIGNYYHGDVLFPNEYEIITAEDIKELSDDPQDDYYQPLELTEELLIKLGFTKNKFYPTFGYKDYCVLHDENGFTFRNDESSDANCYYLCDIKYVHQLQNLYFALTQEELI